MAKLLRLEVLDLSSTIDDPNHLFVEVSNLIIIMARYDASHMLVEVLDEGVELQDLEGKPFGFLPRRKPS